MEKLKSIIIALFALIVSVSVFSQAKKPTIMVVPSDNWCVKNNFVRYLITWAVPLRFRIIEKHYKKAQNCSTSSVK